MLNRIARVIRANFNSLVNNAEDPEKILEQTVSQMQDNLVQLRQAIAQAIATQKRTERQAAQAQATSEEWYRRAQLALQQGNELLAREALTKRRTYQETADTLISQIQQQSIIVNKLKQEMSDLQSKVNEARTKKDMYIARARSAQATAKLQEMLGATTGSSSLSAFERMEDKVLQLEAQAEATAIVGTNELDKKFAALEAGADIDAELEAMKFRLLNRTENTTPDQKELPQNRGI